MPALRAIEAHRFVEYGEQSGLVAGVFRVHHRLFQVRTGFGGCRVAIENRVQSVQELLGIKGCGRLIGIVRGLVRSRIGTLRCGRRIGVVGIVWTMRELRSELFEQCFLVHTARPP